MKEIKLGSEVKDLVSGTRGVATCISTFLNGCVRVSVQRKSKPDGTHQEELWFDIGQVQVVGKGVSEKIKQKNTGGPQTQKPPKMI